MRLPADSAYKILYASPDCPYCRIEVTQWRRRVQSDPSRIAPILLLTRSPEPQEAVGFSDGYPGHVLIDADGSAGRALQVRVVPMTALFDGSGRVTDVRIGVTPESTDPEGASTPSIPDPHPKEELR